MIVEKVLLALSLCVIFAHSYPYFPECSCFNSEATILNSNNGKIKGTCYNVTVNYGSKPKSSNQVLTWLGIPYAEPPINNLRFKKPIPIKSWNDTLDGTNWPNKCVQISGSFDRRKRSFGLFGSKKSHKIHSSEDCLYLNVFVPYEVYVKSVIENNSKYRVPILLYIHGGAFLIGSPADDRTEPSTLIAATNIIVVSIKIKLNLPPSSNFPQMNSHEQKRKEKP
jgi:carboxylesterase type B